MKKIPINSKKSLLFTDIHHGAHDAHKERGLVHNKDNVDYIEWLIEEIKEDPEIDSIMFLGDWNENRAAINLETLMISYQNAKRLNDVGLPVYVILGNHDLYRRSSRTIHSLHFFEQFENFVLIEDPTVLSNSFPDTGEILMCPFLMHGEYTELVQYNKVPVWFGHFEFNGYEVTGYGMQMTGGADPDLFADVDIIVSGHFHKRQAKKGKNVVYMGNPFPTSYGDAGDDSRGYATFDHRDNSMDFFDWNAGPRYIKTTVSKFLDGDVSIDNMCYVKCIVDMPLTHEEVSAIQRDIMTKYHPREFSMEESFETDNIITETQVTYRKEEDIQTVNDRVVDLLGEVDSDAVDSDMLIEIYTSLT